MTELLPLTPDELLTTTRAVRKRLDLERPVERDVIEDCIGIALQAPSGSNRQAWQWLPVDDPDTKSRIADLYRDVFDAYQPRSASYEGDTRAARALALAEKPGQMLSTVQIGITAIGILTGTFGSATLSAIVPVSTEGDSREHLLRNLKTVPVYLLEGSQDRNIRTITGPRALSK